MGWTEEGAWRGLDVFISRPWLSSLALMIRLSFVLNAHRLKDGMDKVSEST